MEQRGKTKPELFERLLTEIGLADVAGRERAVIEAELAGIKRGHDTVASVAQRKIKLEKLKKKIEEHRELRRQLSAIDRQEFQRAAGIRTNFFPSILAIVKGHALPAERPPAPLALIEAFEEEEYQNIILLLDEMQDYHKPPMRSKVIEPFLLFLAVHNRLETTKLARAVPALYDWLGTAPRNRYTESAVRTIKRDLKRNIMPDFMRVYAARWLAGHGMSGDDP